jgi:type IV pilus assembly protein PilY1
MMKRANPFRTRLAVLIMLILMGVASAPSLSLADHKTSHTGGGSSGSGGSTGSTGTASTATAQTLGAFSFIPPPFGVQVRPNILIILDNSGSMNSPAYPLSPEQIYVYNNYSDYKVATTVPPPYSGHFDQNRCYVYHEERAGKFNVVKLSNYLWNIEAHYTHYPDGWFEPDTSGNGPNGFKETISVSGANVIYAPCKDSGGVKRVWDGDFLNYMTMRRIDITKRALTGGECNAPKPRTDLNTCARIEGEVTDKPWYRELKKFRSDVLQGAAPFTGSYCMTLWDGTLLVNAIKSTPPLSNETDCFYEGMTPIIFKIEVKIDTPSGVIQTIGTQARFGLMIFDDTGTLHDGGKVIADIGDSLLDVVKKIEDTTPTSWTPLGETLYQAALYFSQLSGISGDEGSVSFKVDKDRDPYCFSDLTPISGGSAGGKGTCIGGTQGQWVPCCKSFVLLFTDGEPTLDAGVPAPLQDYAHGAIAADDPDKMYHNDVHHEMYDERVLPAQYKIDFASHYLDDVAYWGHTTDLRQTKDITVTAGGKTLVINPNKNNLDKDTNTDVFPGRQNLTLYTFHAFGSGASNILQLAARVGGFRDANGNDRPDLKEEWDKVNNSTRASGSDGIPDNHFEANNADAMRDNLLTALNDMLANVGSGTAISMVSSSSSGEGALFQAYFRPSLSGSSGQVSWSGYLHGLFLDNEGNLREDSVQDQRLVLNQDQIIETVLVEEGSTSTATSTVSGGLRTTKVRRCGFVKTDCSQANLEPLNTLKPIWEAGKLLAERNASTRKITTWIDRDRDKVVDNEEVIPFQKESAAEDLIPYLRVSDRLESERVIDFIRGEKVLGGRTREVGTLTWKLGDILNSDPTMVGAPAEAFDTRFADYSYTRFFKKYEKRRRVVYVGANDGMLHAFNAGYFHSGDSTTTPEVEHGYFTTDIKENKPPGPGVKALGEELWAFIPQELLPHLRWLKGDDYSSTRHVYYVDGTPRISDVRIFPRDGDDDHPNGWGTILIGSMRMGGGVITAKDMNADGDATDAGEGEFRSAYFAFDITNPEKDPKLLWVFSDPDLGFTTSWPAIMPVKGSLVVDGKKEWNWYALVGSGPTTYEGERISSTSNLPFSVSLEEYGLLYVLDINTKNGQPPTIKKKFDIEKTETGAFMGHPAAFNIGESKNEYSFDVAYIGKTFGKKGSWGGKLYRLLPDGDPDPANWTLGVLINTEKPVLTRPTVLSAGENPPWVFFGTGRFLSSDDQADKVAQNLYGLKDGGTNGCWDVASKAWKIKCTNTISTGSLFNSTKVAVKAGGECANTADCLGETTIFDLAKNGINRKPPGIPKDGWIYNLSEGERILKKATYVGGILLVPSYTPARGGICQVDGYAELYALYYETGTAYASLAAKEGPIGLYPGTDQVRETTKNKDGVPTGNFGSGVAPSVAVVVNDVRTVIITSGSGGEIVVTNASLPTPPRQGIKGFREETE